MLVMRAKVLAELIKRIRGTEKVKPFAKAIGVSRYTIHRWESGDGDIGTSGPKLARYLGVALADLESCLDEQTSIEELLRNFTGSTPSRITMGRVLAWFEGLATSELMLILNFISDIIRRRSKPKGISELILKELEKPDRPWSNLDRHEALAMMAEESMLEMSELTSLIDGCEPTEMQLGFLTQVLTLEDGTPWDIEALKYFGKSNNSNGVNHHEV